MRFAKKCAIYILAIAVLLGCAVFVSFFGNKEKAVAEIVLDGKVIKSINLADVSQAYEFRAETDSGYNVILVERGRISVTESDCPDKICVNRGCIGAGDLPIVCLPHKLTITMKSDSGIDAVSGK